MTPHASLTVSAWAIRRPAAGLLALVVAACAVAALAGPAPVVWLLLAAPVMEEIVFRVGLQEALLRRWGERSAAAALAVNVVAALAFAAAHLARHADAQAALTFLPALLIGALYQRQRRVMPCIALHALCNGLWLLAAGSLFSTGLEP